ncbi:hypothetical protein FB45DRAFT_940037 [Roridomyces roridus]|uniref:MPN domain-containing protein n=1 Tax=Roridomyces roridus TaxID=1738132 RepID=A0AAD7B7F7_9AGAR|nr:hypothetical protein FB45DRAFT_940037 [Roridomyces roridus]
MSGLNVGSPSTHISVTYPSLARHMSSHQRTQGYVPGASRWGNAPPQATTTSSPISATDPNENRAGVGATAAMNAARAAAASTTSVVSGPTTFAAMPDPAIARREREVQEQREREREKEELRAAAARADREREEREKGKSPRLRTVVLPQVTLSRFLAIASANTARNLETCGLLLGREVARSSHAADGKTRYVVETLLIPKQHATSDTCTMDEEEGVLVFTEERGLITLGWIHTHPSQSCFMSSVDLHTHASFQRMLPESFAVVCAPKSDPSFGIFRLTDPPGLQTVLTCRATQAFHPHPDVPIYTDADKGHVVMRDAALEIVDLR